VEDVLELVKTDEKIVCDGKRAYMPHPIFQSALFAATRVRRDGEYRKKSLTIVRENQFGDTVTIFTPKTLFVSPDMGVFLATIACAQKAGIYHLIDPKTNDEEPYSLISKFPISWLYELTGMASNGMGWYQLRSSLEALGQVGIRINYGMTKESFKRHGKNSLFAVDNFWRVFIEKRKGRKGSLVKLFPSPVLIPMDFYLWADAELCNKLKSDTAKGIFWQLICREHLAGTAEEWRQWLNAGEGRDAKVWKSRCLMPALEELAGYGYRIKEDRDRSRSERPGVEQKRLSKTKRKR
jgi:hypothetical protein